MSDLDRYPAQVFWSDDDEGYIALATDLPGCSAFGESREVALRELLLAMDAWIKAAVSVGNPVPEPSQPATKPEYSGKILVRMPRQLHAELASKAASEGVSLNQYIVYSLTRSQEVTSAQSLWGCQYRYVPTHQWNLYAPSGLRSSSASTSIAGQFFSESLTRLLPQAALESTGRKKSYG